MYPNDGNICDTALHLIDATEYWCEEVYSFLVVLLFTKCHHCRQHRSSLCIAKSFGLKLNPVHSRNLGSRSPTPAVAVLRGHNAI